MKIIRTIRRMQKLSAQARRRGQSIGFVPTMGALHAGHQALIRRCRKENDLCVASIFVNPTQFGPDEDFRKYPRTKKKDVLLAKKEKVDIILYPSVNEMYPAGYLTTIDVRQVSEGLCGRSRPGHFRGVATVVTKLLNSVNPHRLYLGQKDAQQCVVIKRMIRDLNFPVKMRVVATVRETDGLALSSRNRYLSPRQRQQAPYLYRALQAARTRIRQGGIRGPEVCRLVRDIIRKNTLGKIDYVACVDTESLQPLDRIQGRTLVALAVWFGSARLIDNIIVSPRKK